MWCRAVHVCASFVVDIRDRKRGYNVNSQRCVSKPTDSMSSTQPGQAVRLWGKEQWFPPTTHYSTKDTNLDINRAFYLHEQVDSTVVTAGLQKPSTYLPTRRLPSLNPPSLLLPSALHLLLPFPPSLLHPPSLPHLLPPLPFIPILLFLITALVLLHELS